MTSGLRYGGSRALLVSSVETKCDHTLSPALIGTSTFLTHPRNRGRETSNASGLQHMPFAVLALALALTRRWPYALTLLGYGHSPNQQFLREHADALKATRAHNLLKQNVTTLCLLR